MKHCALCRYPFRGRGCTDHEGRDFCREDHRAQYLLVHPMSCDCGCGRSPQITLGTYRFASSSCLIGFETVT
jgi:hypothetical protein